VVSGRPSLAAALCGALVAIGWLATPGPATASTWTVGVTGGGNASSASDAAPDAPSSVISTCVSSSSNTVRISWSTVQHATAYSVYQATSSATGTYTVVKTGVTSTSWTTGSLGKGSYWFKVAAVVGANWSGPQSAATAQRVISPNGNCT